MKKKYFFSAIAVLSAVSAALIVSSCSSEPIHEEAANCFKEKIEKIQRMAEERGLNISIDDACYGSQVSVADFEVFFQEILNDPIAYVSNVEFINDSTYNLIFIKDLSLNGVAVLSMSESDSQPICLNLEEKTTGDYTISITLKWTATRINVPIEWAITCSRSEEQGRTSSGYASGNYDDNQNSILFSFTPKYITACNDTINFNVANGIHEIGRSTSYEFRNMSSNSN